MKRTLLHTILAFCILFGLLAAPKSTAHAAAIRYVIPNGMISGLCDGWGPTSACRLEYALNTVAASGDEIWVQAGTYKPSGYGRGSTFQLKNGIALYGGFAGTETSRGARDLGITTNKSYLSGDLDVISDGRDDHDAYHIVTASGVNATAVLDGFTVIGGNANGGAPFNEGGGIYINGGSPTLRNLNIEFNYATDNGGGMVIENSSSASITNVTFYQNTAGWNGGGLAIMNTGANPTLYNITFSGNSANYGGGLKLYVGSDPKLKHLTFSANSATTAGGAIDAYDNPFSLTSSILWGDSAPTNAEISARGSGWYSLYGCVVQGAPWSVGNTSENPLLGTLSYTLGNGLRVYPLLPGSSAIDFVTTDQCPSTDARGIARPAGGMCDAGAFENQGVYFSYSGIDFQSTPVNTDFPVPFTISLGSYGSDPIEGGKVSFTPVCPWVGEYACAAAQTVTIPSSGQVSAVMHANGVAGAYKLEIFASGFIYHAVLVLTNTKASTTTGLTSSLTPSTYGQAVTFTATVNVTAPGVGTPGGTVSFHDIVVADASSPAPVSAAPPLILGKPLATFDLASAPVRLAAPVNLAAQMLDAPTFTLKTSTLSAGSHQIVAVYSGDAQFALSQSAVLTQVVNKAQASIVLSNLVQPFNGAPRPVTAATSPGGLAVAITYDGSSTPPSATGSYAVVATVADPNYEGSATGTLVIEPVHAYLPLMMRR